MVVSCCGHLVSECQRLNVCCCSVPSITLSGNADLQGGEGAMGVPTPLHKLQRC